MALADDVARACPAECWLNPVKLICDMFNRLYFFEDLGPFAVRAGALVLMTLVFVAAATLIFGRSRYDTFKTALRMALAHPFYLLIYTVFISLMGVFIAASVSWNSSQLTEYKPYDANVIVVDRDGSDLSLALTKHLGSRFDLGHGVGDDTYDLADALSKSNSAKGSADCVFFIPEGFEDDLVAAARAGESLPKLDVTYGAGTMAAALSSAEASRWISLAGAAAALEPLPPTATFQGRRTLRCKARGGPGSSGSRSTRLLPPRSSRTSTLARTRLSRRSSYRWGWCSRA